MLPIPCDLRREIAAIELRTRERAREMTKTNREAADLLNLGSVKHWKEQMDDLRECAGVATEDVDGSGRTR